MTTPLRVLAALSGGVDSAVAAARVRDAGHEVVGVHLALSKVAHRTGSRGCCSADDARDARRVADILDVPYYVWDMHEEFQESVVEDFLAEYSAGRTPNPCLRCNEQIKFAAVLDRARALGFDAVCTGHYARIIDGVHGRELHRALDPEKDQSYVLAVLNQDQLASAIFPLGDSLKSQVREEARNRGLLVADKPDSHDICFIPDGDTAGWLRERLGAQPGDILDAQTKEPLGYHDGTFAFTIGQRRGLDLRTPAEPGVRRYVVEKDVSTNTVLVGTAELLGVRTLIGIKPRWCGEVPEVTFSCLAQVRAHGDPVPAQAWLEDGEVMVALEEAIRGVACGQAVVLYEDTKVVGSATINVTKS
jgi:tRNA-specific 2-thiouridylase